MRQLLWCLLLTACGSVTEPPIEKPTCPDGMELWHYSYMDTLGVLTEKDLCLPGGTADSLFSGPVAVPTGGIILIICVDGICPDGTVLLPDTTGTG